MSKQPGKGSIFGRASVRLLRGCVLAAGRALSLAAGRALSLGAGLTVNLGVGLVVGPVVGLVVTLAAPASAHAQVPPSSAEQARYAGLFAAAASGDAARIKALLAAGAPVDARDGHGRTPLHVAAHLRRVEAMRALVAGGANPNLLENDRYDIVTIAAVADDLPTLKQALALGCSAKNITSRWDGTALIAAAHLGHAEVVKTLIAAGAPLDHVNNLGWTALIESIVLGDGGARHTATLRALLEAGAKSDISDRDGKTPLALAQSRGYRDMAALLERPKPRPNS